MKLLCVKCGGDCFCKQKNVKFLDLMRCLCGGKVVVWNQKRQDQVFKLIAVRKD